MTQFKKFILLLVLLLSGVANAAADKTAQVLWCESNSTLYFACGDIPESGSTYDGQSITTLWSGDDVTDTGWGTPGWHSIAGSAQKVVFDETFATVRPTSCNRWFYDFNNLRTIECLEHLNTSEVTVMNSMFYNCSSLKTINVDSFDMSKVTNAASMFFACESLTTIYCSHTWNVYGYLMFSACYALRGAVPFDSDVVSGSMANPTTGYFTGRWRVSVTGSDQVKVDKVNPFLGETVTVSTIYKNYVITNLSVKGNHTGEEIQYMDDPVAGNYVFTMPAEDVTVTATAVQNDVPMLIWCKDNRTIYFTRSSIPTPGRSSYEGQTVTKVWSGEAVTNINPEYFPDWLETWHENEKYVQRVVFDESFATVRPTNCSCWFSGLESLETIEGLQYLNTSEVTDMSAMFQDCPKLKTIDLNTFDMSKVTNVSGMFYYCEGLTTIYCDDTWNIAKSEDMFFRCFSLRGAVAFDNDERDGNMANPENGYFTCKWNVTVYDVDNGEATVTNLTPYTNETVAVIVTADKNYAPQGVSVRGAFTGEYVTVTDTGDGIFTFTMPAEDVFVNVAMKSTVDAFVAWCEGNQTLYFAYDGVPKPGGTYQGQTVTNVWSGFAVTDTDWGKPGWSSINASVNKVVIDKAFEAVRPTSCYAWFWSCTNLSEIQGLEYLNTSEVTNMNSMFAGNYKITSLDLRTFDVSMVTNASAMFNKCDALTTIYCDDTWNIATAENMFAGCNNLVGVVKFDSSKTDGSMANPATGYFIGRWAVTLNEAQHCTANVDKTVAFLNDIVTVTAAADENYTLKAITVTGARTGNTVQLTEGDNGSWSFVMPAEPVTVKVTPQLTYGSFAAWCEGNTTLYFANGDIPEPGSTYNEQTVTSVWRGDELTDWVGYPGWIDGYAITGDVRKVVFDESFAIVRPTNCSSWFMRMINLTDIVGLNYLNTSEVTKMDNMFQYCRSLTEIDVTNFDTRKLSSTTNMFLGCSSLTSLKVNNFDMSKVEYADQMFYNCSSLKTIYCAKTWDITNTGYMFYGCTSLVGVAAYDSEKTDGAMANPVTSYFTGKWEITVADVEHATVTAESKAYANEKVTITATADEGYAITAVTVTGNTSGNAVEVTAGEDGTYTFTMPAEPVTVTVRYLELTYTLDGVSFTVERQWATWCGGRDLALPAGIAAYTVTAVTDDAAQVEALDYIPAATGVLLYSTVPAEAVTTTAYDGTTIAVAGNLLVGVAEDTVINDGYVLYGNQFWRSLAGTLPAHRAYLPADVAGTGADAPRALRIVAGGSIVTAVERIDAAGSAVRHYDVSGRYIGTTLDHAPQGVYITGDGRKVVK